MTQATNDQISLLSTLVETVSEWPGVATSPHRFGGTEFVLGEREIGHVHRSGIVDIAYPRRVRDQLVEDGHTGPHHIYPNSGWTTFRLVGPDAAERATWLLRLSYLYHARIVIRRPDAEADLADLDPDVELAAMKLDADLGAAMGIRNQ